MRRIWADGLGNVFKSSKHERYLFSKQLTLNPFIFASQTQALAGVLGRKLLKMTAFARVLFSKKSGGDRSRPLHFEREARPASQLLSTYFRNFHAARQKARLRCL
jgi:hypothetical protein